MLDKYLFIKQDRANLAQLLVYMAIAVVFSLMIRQIYIAEVQHIKEFYHNGVLMINNNDGYAWAEGARDILAGHHQKNDLSPVDYPISIMTAYLAKFLHIDLDTLIFYLPGVLGSLLAVPLVLIGYELGSVFLGFLAALLAPIAWSYYHRTMYGYYDTDMLIIVLPTFAIWGILKAFATKAFRHFWIGPLFLILGIWWHHGLYQIANGIFVMALFYVLLFDRDKRNFLYLALLLIPVLQIAIVLKILFLFLANYLLFRFDDKLESHLKYFLVAVVAIYLALGGAEWIVSILKSSYFTRNTTVSEEGLKFYGVINTVREASHISFDTLVHRISGSYIGFFAGALGYVLLLIRFPRLLVSLPMVILGLYAMRGGLRFTIFAVPFFALGDAFIILLVANWLRKFFLNDQVGKIFYYAFSLLLMGGIIYPNVVHAKKYIMPAVLSDHEVKILEKLKKIAKRDDYVLTWWDYGYPIRYYADVKTLIDGGKHTGDVNFPVSFALSTSSQKASVNMAILDVYFTEKFYNEHIKGKTYLEAMMQMYGFKDPDKFLAYLDGDIKLPSIKENIYYYLPLRMLGIFPTVTKFSDIDLKTGKTKRPKFYYISRNYKKVGDILYLGHGMELLLKSGILRIGKQQVPLNRYATVTLDKEGKVHVNEQLLSMASNISMIHMPQYGKILVVDNYYYDSTYFQLFIFEHYDKKLFEPVILDPMVKIYRVKK